MPLFFPVARCRADMVTDGGVAEGQPDGAAPPATTVVADPWADWAGAQPRAHDETTNEAVPADEQERPDTGDGEVATSGNRQASWHRSSWEDSTWDRQPTWSSGEQWRHGGQWQRDPWGEDQCHGRSRDWRSNDGHDDRWSDSSHHGWRDHHNGSTTSTTTPSTERYSGRPEHATWHGEWWQTDARDNADSGRARDGHHRGEWRRTGGHDHPEEVQRRGEDDPGHHGDGLTEKRSNGTISERMSVPTFSADGSGEELGQSARSYLRQVEAWAKVTRAPASQRALLLYQNLSGRAWVEAEELRVADLAKDDGVEVFRRWVQERYQEIEVSKIAESLTAFFKRLRRQQGQSIREFNSLFDRAHTRLLEIDCRLPEVAKAWAYLNALGLAHNEELALLASVNNEYSTAKIQRAAILHEKSLRAPWSFRKNTTVPYDKSKGTRAAYVTDLYEDGEGSEINFDEDLLPEEVAVEVHEAFMAHETAKARLREVTKNRGVDMDAAKGVAGDKSPEERLRLAKSRSFCAGCKRRGHWHRDAECPLNQGAPKSGDAKTKPPEQRPDKGPRDSYVVYVAFEVGEVGIREGLLGITDCACSRSVCGQEWMERYLSLAKRMKLPHPFLSCKEEFRFGASKIFKATYAVLVIVTLQDRTFVLKVAVVDGDVPLLLSRSVLGCLGMVYDIERHEADFRALGIHKYQLSLTHTGHPAIPVSPKRSSSLVIPSEEDWGTDEVRHLAPDERTIHGFHDCLSRSFE